jgi:aspartyl-tRNA(Asn)/glutamyl-tRNA(Gln) amidotransferase subunit A
MNDYHYLTIKELSERLIDGEITSVELVDIFHERYLKLDSKLNSFLTYDSSKQVRREAAKLDEERNAGTVRGPLHGVPLSIKDNIATAGMRTTSGSKIYSSFVPGYDAAVVEKLKEAGAIILGKNNLAEFAYSVLNENPHYGAVRNPWDLSRATGGSSGGSASAVAAGLAAGSLGSDTGGSIRIPSSFCGVVGIKPTFGRSSLFGITPLSWSMDHVGPITRSVWDAALLLQTIAGHDYRDPSTSKEPTENYLEGLTGRKSNHVKHFTIGILREFFFESLDPGVRRATEKILSLLREGDSHYKLIDIEFREARHLRRLGFLILASEASSYHKPLFLKKRRDYGQETRERIDLGFAVTAVEYVDGQRMRRFAAEEFLRATKGCDALITPTLPITAPKIGAKVVLCGEERASPRDIIPRFTTPFNVLGIPAISVPIGLSRDLPTGIQIIGRLPFSENVVFRVGSYVEKLVEENRLLPTDHPFA